MKTKFLLFAFLLFAGRVAAQSDSLQPIQTKAPVSYMPRLEGGLKARMEVDLNGAAYRFNVRNARFGVRGNVTSRISYRFQVDFSNEGKFVVLDAYAGYKAGGFEMIFGQQQYHFSTDMDRGLPTSFFANRSMLAKYLTSYYGSELSGGKEVGYVRTLGSRDLGVNFSYKFNSNVPVKLLAGLFNGSGVNNPVWSKRVNVISRIELGGSEGLQGSLSYYGGYAPQHLHVVDLSGGLVNEPFEQSMRMFGAELRYVHKGLFVEGEYARRYLGVDGRHKVLTAALIQGYYRFILPQNRVAEHIAPTLRWDLGNNVDYLNTTTKQLETFYANRITVGVDLGFGLKPLRSVLRLNYEKYLLEGGRPSDFDINKLLHDKFTVEIVVVF